MSITSAIYRNLSCAFQNKVGKAFRNHIAPHLVSFRDPEQRGYLPLGYLSPKKDYCPRETLEAPRSLTVGDINNPSIRTYFFRPDQIINVFPEISKAFSKTCRLFDAEGKNIGSGVLISNEGHVLTSAHVIQRLKNNSLLEMGDQLSKAVYGLGHLIHYKPTDIKLVFTGNWREYYEKIIYDPDIAIIQIPALSNQGCIDLANEPLNEDIGSTLFFTIGNPEIMNDGLRVSTGIITSTLTYFDHFPITGPFLTSDAETRSGNSGGPFINEDGNLLAIHVSRQRDSVYEHCIPVWKGSRVYEMARLDQYFQ